MIKYPFALTLGPWQRAVVQYLNLGAHQNVLPNGTGDPDSNVMIVFGPNTRPSFHLQDHTIPAIRHPFKMHLEFAANLRDL